MNDIDFSYIQRKTWPKNDEHLFEVDENMAPVISLLNKKGYITQFCCEGHKQRVLGTRDEYCFTGPYISFASYINLPSIPKKWHTEISYTITNDNGEIVDFVIPIENRHTFIDARLPGREVHIERGYLSFTVGNG